MHAYFSQMFTFSGIPDSWRLAPGSTQNVDCPVVSQRNRKNLGFLGVTRPRVPVGRKDLK